jgi:hypothetical protein
LFGTGGKFWKKLWKLGDIESFVVVNQGKRMKASKNALPFRKTAACPASSALLAFRVRTMSAGVAATVQEHLGVCDFCSAELKLLAHHRPAIRGYKTPEMPMNLRILAESILKK